MAASPGVPTARSGKLPAGHRALTRGQPGRIGTRSAGAHLASPPQAHRAGARPAETHPGQAGPAETHPGQVGPAETHPGQAGPAETHPAGPAEARLGPTHGAEAHLASCADLGRAVRVTRAPPEAQAASVTAVRCGGQDPARRRPGAIRSPMAHVRTRCGVNPLRGPPGRAGPAHACARLRKAASRSPHRSATRRRAPLCAATPGAWQQDAPAGTPRHGTLRQDGRGMRWQIRAPPRRPWAAGHPRLGDRFLVHGRTAGPLAATGMRWQTTRMSRTVLTAAGTAAAWSGCCTANGMPRCNHLLRLSGRWTAWPNCPRR